MGPNFGLERTILIAYQVCAITETKPTGGDGGAPLKRNVYIHYPQILLKSVQHTLLVLLAASSLDYLTICGGDAQWLDHLTLVPINYQ